jgi:hypothetical protein
MNRRHTIPSISRGVGGAGHLTNRAFGRARGKVPSPNAGVRAAQLNR